MKNNQLQKNIFNEWHTFNFNQIVSVILDFRGKTPLKLGMEWGHGSIPALSANNVKKGYIDFDSECHLASEELYNKWMNKGGLKEGDIIFTMEAPLGNVAIIPDNKKYLLSQRVVALKFVKGISSLFMYHYLLSNVFQSKLDLLGTGSTAKGINQKSLFKIRISLPPLPEQHRIVAVLETWDKAIEKLNQKIEIKKEVKKGLMQNLLTGKKRLPGFSGEWHYIKIENLISLVQGKKSNGGDNMYLEIGDININNNHYNINEKNKLTVKGAVMVPKGTLLISTVRPTRGAITITKENIFVSSAFCRLNIKNLFIYYVVNTKNFLNYLGDNSGGGTYPTCKSEDILNYDFLAPDSIDEQTAIAQILSKADAEINLLEKKLTLFKDQKKFLLNNLITGKIRTPENLKIH